MKPHADNSIGNSARTTSAVELYAPYWYARKVPSRINVLDASLKIPGLQKAGAFHAFYGRRGRTDGFMAVRDRARLTGHEYSAIDIAVRFDHQITQHHRTIDDLADHEILSVNLVTAELSTWLDDRLRADLHMRRTMGDERTARALMRTLEERPSAVAKLLSYPELEHIRLLVHVSRTDLGQTPLPIATIPERHFDCIVGAKSRFDPDLVIDLPAGAPAPAPADAAAPREGNSPTPPRA